MFSRHINREEKPSQIPTEILNFIDKLIDETFKESFSKKNLKLSVFGELYENEIVLIFSLVNSTDSSLNTISLFISDDISPTTKLEKTVDSLINSSSEFFETVTSSTKDEIDSLYSPRWQQAESPTESFYYKVSRENIALTIEANKLLEQ